jgi:eukaryotic-like serine/threonine-protein kinase
LVSPDPDRTAESPVSETGDEVVPRRDRLAVGTQLAGRYRVDAHLGGGGMGEVYRVHDERLGEDVALKLLSFDHDSAAARFRREVKLARRITHPNVARTHDIGEHEGRPFLTMELIAGETLADRLDRSLLDPDEAAAVCATVGQGLRAAHAADVIHRDLKPGNVMIEEGGRVVITDFGIARSMVDDKTVKASQAMGTPFYMSPEQLMGESVTKASDVYALGLLLYEMITGELPFVGDTPMGAVLARCQSPPRDPRELKSMPDVLAELILACLCRKPADRPPLAAVADRLATWSSAASAHTVASTSFRTSSLPSISSPFAPISLGKRRLAVLPFTFRGTSEHDYLGDTLAQELIDVLSRMRGMKVLAFGATSAHHDVRDPRAVGAELGVETIVGGDVMASASRVRVAVRLLDVDSGEQLWSDRLESDLADVFHMQEIVSQRVAEALRVELDIVGERWRASAETIDLYLRGRRAMAAQNLSGSQGAVELFEECIARESFGPAVAAHAVATIKAWWVSLQRGDGGKWSEVVAKSVARALEQAPELAESHFAAGAFAMQDGRTDEAVRYLASSLDIAPANAEAQRYLGELQCEAGRVEEGVRRLHLALELDPSQSNAYFGLARIAALQGDFDRATKYADALAKGIGNGLGVMIVRVRFAGWKGDEAEMREWVEHASAGEGLVASLIASFGRYVLGEQDESMIDAALGFVKGFDNPRMVALIGQLIVEALSTRGNIERGMEVLELIADGALVDVYWLERCPALTNLREHPSFKSAQARVRQRADALWQV